MRQGTAEFEDWEIRLIRKFRAAGVTHKKLVHWFGASQPVMSRICRGQAYKDAGGPIETSYRRHTV